MNEPIYPTSRQTKEQLEEWAARLLFAGDKLGEPLMEFFNAWNSEVRKIESAVAGTCGTCGDPIRADALTGTTCACVRRAQGTEKGGVLPGWIFDRLVATLEPAWNYIRTHQEQFGAGPGDDKTKILVDEFLRHVGTAHATPPAPIAHAWRTTEPSVCVPMTEDPGVAALWREAGFDVIDLFESMPVAAAVAVGAPQPLTDAILMRMLKDENRGDPVYRCGYNQAIENVRKILAMRSYLAPPAPIASAEEAYDLQFPVALRKMWAGWEVQKWLDDLPPLYTHPAAAHPSTAEVPTNAARDVLAERQRQVSVEGWTSEHDNAHPNGDMAIAAACYAANAGGVPWSGETPSFWPWSNNWWKPTTPRRDLIKAGALILAEIERIDRSAKA